MKLRLLPLLAFVMLFVSCSSSNTKVTKSWVNKDAVKKEKINSIFIAALTPNIENRTTLENELAYWAKQNNLKPIKSHDVFPDVNKNNMPSKEELLNSIRGTKSEVIFTIALKKVETADYARASLYIPVEPNVSFYGYYSNVFPLVYDVEYYSPDKTYFMESNIYDAETEELLWSAKSETYNPSDYENFIKGYVNTLFKQLEKDGLLKKGAVEPNYK
jgi:hypothetical protein